MVRQRPQQEAVAASRPGNERAAAEGQLRQRYASDEYMCKIGRWQAGEPVADGTTEIWAQVGGSGCRGAGTWIEPESRCPRGLDVLSERRSDDRA